MRFTSALLVLSPLVAALDYFAFSNTVDCTGPNFECSDGGGRCCSGWPSQFGFSAAWFGLPTGGQGQGYTDTGCTAFTFEVFGPGTLCFKTGGNTRAASLNWFHASGKRGAEDDVACAPPVAFNYIDQEGKGRSIAIASKEEAYAIGMHYAAGNLTALVAFPTYKQLSTARIGN